MVSNTDSAALVTDAASGTSEGLFEDVYEWHIPQINLTGSEIEAVNDEIWTFCNDYVEWNYEQIEEGNGNQVLLDCSWYVNSDVLSLVIDVIYSGDLACYYIYNIAISTGEVIADDELLNYFNLTKESYEELAEQVRYDFYASYSFGGEVEPYSTNLFINDDGELCLAETADLGRFVINLGVFID